MRSVRDVADVRNLRYDAVLVPGWRAHTESPHVPQKTQTFEQCVRCLWCLRWFDTQILRICESYWELTELMCFWTLSCGKSFGLSWLGLRPETELVAVVACYITWGECLSVVPHETEKITLAVDGEDCLASLFLCSLLMPRPSMTHCKTFDSFYRLSVVPQCLEHPKWSKCGVLQDSDSDSSGSSALSPWDPWVKLQVMSCWSESSASISLIEHDWKRSNDPEYLQLDRRWDHHELFLRKPLHESRLFFARLTLGQNAISEIFGQGACT